MKNQNIKLVIKLVIPLLMLFSTYSCAADNSKNVKSEERTIEPGVGVGDFVLLRSTMSDIITEEKTRDYYQNQGLFFTFEDGGYLTNILITSDQYITDKNISVGSSVEEVFNAYGNASEQAMSIIKSEKIIGSAGSKLVYSGIQFMINNDKVSGILIVPFE